MLYISTNEFDIMKNTIDNIKKVENIHSWFGSRQQNIKFILNEFLEFDGVNILVDTWNYETGWASLRINTNKCVIEYYLCNALACWMEIPPAINKRINQIAKKQYLNCKKFLKYES